MTTTSNQPPEDFAAAAHQWDLERLYLDLVSAKIEVASRPTRKLTDVEKLHLRGLLCGYNPKEIAEKLNKQHRGVEADLSKTLYRYIEVLTKRELKTLNNWRDVVDWLAEAGYQIQQESNQQVAPPIQQTASYMTFFAYDSSWVGRETLINNLSTILRTSCRLLLILGLTGIGKTALAERLAVEMQDWFHRDWKNKFCRANFDYQEKSTDFASVAARWLEEWGEKLSSEDNKPERLLQRLVKYLCENQVLVLIDSLERLLVGNEEDGWGNFVDEWWEKFFLSLLSAEVCQSRLIITSQDLPLKLVDSRYKNFWHCQILYGLDESEQEALFSITGLDLSQESPNRTLLMRLGKAYKGHPLVLRVMIGEICESYDSNVQAYWNDISSKIEEVENALSEAEADARKIVGSDDDWKLHKLTQKVGLEVNKQRLEAVFDRLEIQVRDAYILICAASVYRLPVQKEGWLMQLANLVKRLEHQVCSEERQEKALEELYNRFLVEKSINYNKIRVLGQHNLIRSVALEHHKQLLQRLKNEGQSHDQ